MSSLKEQGTSYDQRVAVLDRPTPGILTIDGALTQADLRDLAAVVESADLTAQNLGQPSRTRTRRRGDIRSPAVPLLLWRLLQPYLGDPVDWYPSKRPPQLEPPIDEWAWSGCNDLTRFYEYGPGDEFRPHTDESWRATATRRSLLTVLVYLPTGEPCEGGETVVDGYAIAPAHGRVALFDHRLVHAGQPVLAGQKLVLRNDVIAEVPA